MEPADLQALAAARYSHYARHLPGISLEQIKRLCELEYLHATTGDHIVTSGLNVLLDELCKLVQLSNNDILVLVENAIRRMEKTGLWAELEEIIAIIRTSKRAIREQVFALLHHPQTVCEHLEEEARFLQAIARGQAALSGAKG